MRAQSDAEFHEAVEEANGLHVAGALFARQIEPEPAPADPVDSVMAEASDDEDDAPMPDAPLEPELIDMPPAPASAPPMSNLERCIALRLVHGAGPRQRLQKMPPASHLSVSLSVVSRVGCLVCLAHACVSTSSHTSPRLPGSQTVTEKKSEFFFFFLFFGSSIVAVAKHGPRSLT